MPEFCQYLNCHNLGSILYDGYCNQDHMQRGPEIKFLMEIVRTHKDISTIKEARAHKALTSSSRCFVKSEISQKHIEEDCFTSSSRCEECKELLHGSGVYRAK